jgi:FkbM family methyltransferase
LEGDLVVEWHPDDAASDQAMKRTLKDAGKRIARFLGYEVRRVQPPGSSLRPIGRTASVLEDVRARGFHPRTIFDIGASDGSWTRMAAGVFPDATVILVDPRPDVAAALTAFCQSNPRFTAERAAVGAHAGSGTMTDWETGSTLLPVDPAGFPQFTVPVVTLDALAARWGVPELVKMDIEGLEIEGLQAASSLLGVTDVFIIEVSLFRFVDRPMLHDVVAFMERHDYVIYDFGDPIRRPFDGAVGLVDLCFARREGRVRASERAWHAASTT